MPVLKYRDPTTGGWIIIPSGQKGDPGPAGPPGGVFPGAIVAFGGVTAKIPAGYLACVGGTVNRVTYAQLFDAIGTTWGIGDGVNTFGLPDGQGRNLVGASGSFPLGTVGGSANLVLPSHVHSVRGGTGTTDWQSADHAHGGTTGYVSSDHSHAVGMSDAGGLAGGGSLVRKGGTGSNQTGGISANHTHDFSTYGVNANHYHALSVDANGVDPTNKNLPPWAAVTFVIKY